MRRILSGGLLALAMIGTEARAQYIERGIGGGATPQGDYLRGLGMAAWGMGSYNRDTAIGYSITVDADIRLDTYVQAVLRAGRDNWARLDRQNQAKLKRN